MQNHIGLTDTDTIMLIVLIVLSVVGMIVCGLMLVQMTTTESESDKLALGKYKSKIKE